MLEKIFKKKEKKNTKYFENITNNLYMLILSFSLSALSLILRAWHAGFAAGSSAGSVASSGTHDVLVLSKKPGPSAS
jgi:hypothetical protein